MSVATLQSPASLGGFPITQMNGQTLVLFPPGTLR
jgi:hypothetical protein